jgi:hypothetical protein
MSYAKRFRQPWTINECINLEREFDFLHLSIDEIAERHQRTPNAIMYKLHHEGIADYNTLYRDYTTGQSFNEQEEYDDCDNSSDYSEESDEDEDEDEDEDYNLHKRVTELENRMEELMEALMSQKKKSGLLSSLFA